MKLIASDPKVKLITVTPNAEKIIVRCARVSNPNNQSSDEIERLIRYCIRHKHWSIFETASMTVEIKTSRAISAQLTRHRSFTFQEFSQRYSKVQPKISKFQLRQQAQKNRQASKVFAVDDTVSWNLIDEHLTNGIELYNTLIERGIARECARMILPLSIQTTLYMTGNVRSWIHYLQLRTSPDTQKEHRWVAEQCKAIFDDQFPIIASAMT